MRGVEATIALGGRGNDVFTLYTQCREWRKVRSLGLLRRNGVRADDLILILFLPPRGL